MPRWRKRSRRRLSDDERAILVAGPLFAKRVDETAEQCVDRVFGSLSASREAWLAFRVEIMTTDPLSASRPWGWWQFEARPGWEADYAAPPPAELKILPQESNRIRPIPWDQAATLRRLKALRPLEILQQLKEIGT